MDALRELRAMLEGYHAGRARVAGWVRGVVPTGLRPLDAALPGGGIPRGAVTEIHAEGPGVGAMTVALRMQRGAGNREQGTGRRDPGATGSLSPKYLVLVESPPEGDGRFRFYPPAMVERGVPLDRLIFIRTFDRREAFWAVDQALCCPAVGAVIAVMKPLEQRLSRRLQLAAESSGCVGILLMFDSARRAAKSFAAVQMVVESANRHLGVSWQPGKAVDSSFLCRISLRSVREGTPAGPIEVDLHHETGVLRVPAVSGNRQIAVVAG